MDWLGPAGVLAVFAASAFVIPTLANVAVTDDWVYYRSVETLLVQHRLEVPQMASAALVFQTVWGALFAAAFGLSFGVLRVSTLVMVGLGGVAAYGLLRALGVSRMWSTLGLAAYVFHPLSLALAYTFMTDPQYVALCLAATWLYVRGVRAGRGGQIGAAGWVVAGSVVASCAMLVRQQGVLIPAAVFGALVLSGRLRSWRRGLGAAVQTCGVPAVVFVAYSLWLRYGNGTPYALGLFSDDLAHAGWAGVLELVPRLGIIEAIYVGLFVLPLGLAALAEVVGDVAGRLEGARQPPPAAHEHTQPASRGPSHGASRAEEKASPTEEIASRADEKASRGVRVRGWRLGALLAWAVLAAGGALSYWLDGQKAMPYVGQFVTPSGLGPDDLIAARPLLMQPPERVALTVACVIASIVAAWLLLRWHAPPGPALFVAAVALGQVVGTLPASIHFVAWGGTLDRYLLPLLPFCVVLLLAAFRPVRGWASLGLAWLAVIAMGAWSVAGTHDHLAFLQGVWSLAGEANAIGIDNVHLDAGAGWDGFHDYVAPPDPAVRPRTPNPPWWADLFAPGIDSSYVIAGATLPGYTVVEQGGYTSWLRQESMPLYLLRRPGVAGPP